MKRILFTIVTSIALAFTGNVNARNGLVGGIPATPVPKSLNLCVKEDCACVVPDTEECNPPAYTENFIWRRPSEEGELGYPRRGRCWGSPDDPYYLVQHECHVFDACFPEFTAWYGGKTFTTIPDVKKIEFGVEFYSDIPYYLDAKHQEFRLVDDVQIFYVDKDDDEGDGDGWDWRWDQTPAIENTPDDLNPWWGFYTYSEERDLKDYPGSDNPWDYHNGNSVIRVYFRKAGEGPEAEQKAIQINIGGEICHRWFPSLFFPDYELPEWGWPY